MDDNFDSFTCSGLIILFIKTSSVHFDVFLLMRLVRADIYVGSCHSCGGTHPIWISACVVHAWISHEYVYVCFVFVLVGT